jgi:hypothetical protein
MPVDIEKIKLSTQEKQAIKDNDPTNIPIDATEQGWTGDQIRAQIAASITADEGSVLSELDEKTTLISDKFVEVDTAMNTRDNQVSTNVTNIQTNANDIDALETGKLSRDGSQPMLGDLDMDDHQILNANIEATNILVNDVNIQNIIDDVDGLKDGTVLSHSAKNANDGLGNASTAQAIKQTVDHVNQDVKDTSTPTFVGVTLGDKTLTETKLNDLENCKCFYFFAVVNYPKDFS